MPSESSIKELLSTRNVAGCTVMEPQLIKPDLDITLNTSSGSEEEATRLKDRIQQVVEAEIADYQRLLPSEGGSIDAPAPSDVLPSPVPLEVSLKGLSLPEEQTEQVEIRVKHRLAEIFSSEAVNWLIRVLSPTVHVALSRVVPPGATFPLGSLQTALNSALPRLELEGEVWWLVVLPADGACLWMFISVHSQLNDSEMLAGLRVPKGVPWNKEIAAWRSNAPGGFVESLVVGPGADEKFMFVGNRTSGQSIKADTLVARKPGFAGFPVDVLHFQTAKFWEVFGGREAHFAWLQADQTCPHLLFCYVRVWLLARRMEKMRWFINDPAAGRPLWNMLVTATKALWPLEGPVSKGSIEIAIYSLSEYKDGIALLLSQGKISRETWDGLNEEADLAISCVRG